MLSLIVAMDRNNLIGIDNKLPWHFKEDLEYFKEKTMNKKVLMGKNTFLSIFDYLKKPLPNRENYVLTSEELEHEGIHIVRDLHELLTQYVDPENDDELLIIGGAKLYEIGLEEADRLYITHIDAEFEGNVYFPKVDYSMWRVIEENKVGDLNFVVYERR